MAVDPVRKLRDLRAFARRMLDRHEQAFCEKHCERCGEAWPCDTVRLATMILADD